MNRFLRDISIRRKLTLLTMGASTVALLLVSAGFIGYELVTFRSKMVREVSILANIIGNRSTAALVFENPEDAEEDLNCLEADSRIVAACLYRNGQVFAHYPASAADSMFPAPRENSATFRPDRLEVFHTIRSKGEEVGVLYLASDLREQQNRLQSYGKIIVLFMVASLGATFVFSTALQRIITAPIFHLAETAREVSTARNYGVRARAFGNDELGGLITGFNEMLEQIQQRDHALQKANDELESRVKGRTRDLEAEISERKRAEAALQRQFARMSLLNRITQAIAERQDLTSILRVLLRQLEDHLGTDFGGILLFEPPAQTFNTAALRLKNPLLAKALDWPEGAVISLQQSGLARCKEGELVYVPDTVREGGECAEKLARAGLRSAATVPLIAERELFGVLMVARLKADGFSGEECEFLRTLSEHVALAGHQAYLHSELEKAYKELQKTQQTVMQQERLKALGQMASGIAHDINNALSPVVGFPELLVNSEPALSPQGRKYLTYIKTAGEDIAHIVARLRDFYRRREEKEDLQALDLNTLAMQVIDMTRPRWRDIPQGRGVMVEMHTDFAHPLPAPSGIQSEVREALTNLILNAVDALPDGGRITVRTLVRQSVRAGNSEVAPGEVMLEVADSGIGMDEQTRQRCLEPFFSTKGQRGTGLGLAMVYGVMERHEGRIEVESELGRGTLMRLVFPLRTRSVAALDVAPGPQKTARPLQILCIDDEPLLRELIREMLQREGHRVQVTDGGQAGVDAFRAASRLGQPFDVVITDLGMPYLDGRQVARIVKSESPNTPIVLLTGWGAFMKQDGELPPQVDRVLSKPPRSAELREVLHRLVTGPRS